MMTSAIPVEKMPAYPGEFIPKMKHSEEIERLCRQGEEGVDELKANVIELQNCYRVEMAVPGARSEDFVVRVMSDTISVIVQHDRIAKNDQEKFKLHEFSDNYTRRDICLPGAVDPHMATAEYCNGVLTIHLRKNGNQWVKWPVQIVVY